MGDGETVKANPYAPEAILISGKFGNVAQVESTRCEVWSQVSSSLVYLLTEVLALQYRHKSDSGSNRLHHFSLFPLINFDFLMGAL